MGQRGPGPHTVCFIGSSNTHTGLYTNINIPMYTFTGTPRRPSPQPPCSRGTEVREGPSLGGKSGGERDPAPLSSQVPLKGPVPFQWHLRAKCWHLSTPYSPCLCRFLLRALTLLSLLWGYGGPWSPCPRLRGGWGFGAALRSYWSHWALGWGWASNRHPPQGSRAGSRCQRIPGCQPGGRRPVG